MIGGAKISRRCWRCENGSVQWPSSEVDEVSERELLRRDLALLEMWPEACRRVGLEAREFPPEIIERWRQIGRGRPN